MFLSHLPLPQLLPDTYPLLYPSNFGFVFCFCLFLCPLSPIYTIYIVSNVLSSTRVWLTYQGLYSSRKPMTSPDSYQFPAAPQLKLKIFVYTLPTWWDLVWLDLAQVLCVLCVTSSISSYVQLPCSPDDAVSLYSFITSGSHILFVPSSATLPEPYEKGVQ